MDGDFILFNGSFHTMEAAAPRASAIAVRDGRIHSVGDHAGVRAAVGGARGTRSLDLQGRCVLPGLTDSHLHFKWFAESLAAVDVETATLDEAVARVRARAEEAGPGAWITGSGWNHNVWGTGALPNLGPLDRAAPRNPVALQAKSGHALWVNYPGAAEGGYPAGDS